MLEGGAPLCRAVERAPQLVVAPLLILLSVSAACLLVGETAILAAAAYLFAAMLQVGAARPPLRSSLGGK